MTASWISRSLRASLTWGNDASRRNGDDGPAGGDVGGGPGARGAGIRRRLHRRDQPRPVPPDRARRARDRAHRARHRHRGGVRPQPDVDGRHRQRPPAVHEGPVHPRPRQPDQAPYREAVLDAVVGAGEADARVHPRHAGHLGVLERGRQARLPRRVLPPHAHDTVLQPGTQSVRHPEGVPRRRRRAHDRGGGRGRRRDPAPRLHDRAVRARGHHAALERGWARAGKQRGDFELSGPMFVVTGTNEEEYEAARRGTKQQIAFYGSTPAYRGVLELHGWGDLQGDLNRLSKQGEWVQMGELVDDEILGTFAVTGEPEEIPAKMLDRYGDVVDRISFYAPYKSDPERWSRVVEGFKRA